MVNSDCGTGDGCDVTTRTCDANLCHDGILDGTETDVDCGGGTCPVCAVGKMCTVDSDCAAGDGCDVTTRTCDANQCHDGIQDGNETDVDCGGGACPVCAVGKKCTVDSDCVAGDGCDVTSRTCDANLCHDGIQDGTETDVDCGGATCPACAVGKRCAVDGDCMTGDGCDISTRTCDPNQCHDGILDGNETDVDCGGGTCTACALGKKCAVDSDCVAGDGCDVTSKTCDANLCHDGIQDGSETDVDCGGGTCAACAVGKKCMVNTDCVAGDGCDVTSKTCDANQCHDGILDGNETDVDCGGATCPGCAVTKKCNTTSDCAAGEGCDISTRTCDANECHDGVQDGSETDVDCGGGTCAGCIVGKKCNATSDCVAGAGCDLTTKTCSASECHDGIQDGNETDVDCGGGMCPLCPDGDKCAVGTDCTDKVCSGAPLVCQAPSCSDGVQNGTETGVDCGGAACAACGTGLGCVKATDCASMVCSSGKCSAPACNDGVQNGYETDVDCGGAGYMSAAPCPLCAPGKKCANSAANCQSDVCTNDFCQVPTCSDGIKNGNETDVDCGGSGYMGAAACPPCNPGEKCLVPGDCVGDTCQTTCQCPTGMLTVPIQGGGIFCIDTVEVTYAAYNTFYSANPTTASQPTYCSWNLGWTPTGAWPYVATNANEPVRYVNWCQAAGYCAYEGKRLCGKIGGGSTPQASFDDFSKDQWFDACTAQGANCNAGGCYPYGAAYDGKECNGADDTNFTPAGPQPYTSLFSCQGGAPSLYNMSGNVAEWEDSCDATTGISDECAIRGGSYADDSEGLRCDSGQTTGPITQTRGYQGNDVGFRCCL